jgi:hypothetical protein
LTNTEPVSSGDIDENKAAEGRAVLNHLDNKK